MNKTKQKQNSLFDLSKIIEKIKTLEEQKFTMFQLNKRPNYELIKQSNSQFIPQIINDIEIKRKFMEIKQNSLLPWKPILIPINQNKSQIHPKQINTTPKPQEQPIEKKNHSKSIEVLNEVKKRAKSTDVRILRKKTLQNDKFYTEINDMEAQFLETRKLINRFNRIKKKSVRFNILT